MITNFNNIDESRLSAEERVQYDIECELRELMRVTQKMMANSFYGDIQPSPIFYWPHTFEEEYEKSIDELELDAIAKLGIGIAKEHSLKHTLKTL
jgi:hypothetical protein